MSVLVTFRLRGDPEALEKHAAGDPDGMRAISDRAKEHGVIAHRFYGSDDGQIMVVDEWPDMASFRSFFRQEREAIEPMMRAAGVTSEPDVTVWRKLESRDEVGWGA